MKSIKIGTFNMENLYNRYKLLDNEKGSRKKKAVDPEKFLKEGGHINMLGWSIDDYGPIGKSLRAATAEVILENRPDILAVQEVENLFALLAFNRRWLHNEYPYAMVIDGNDLRQIDVGILSKFPFVNLRTHQFEPENSPPTERIFSRDCLEAEIGISPDTTLTMLVNHFKSKIDGGEEKRERQARRVAEILAERFGKSLSGNFVVAGDFNSHNDAPELQPLLSLDRLENVVAKRLPEEEQWTYYFTKEKTAEQFDYLLISRMLSYKNPSVKPMIERRGLGTDVKHYKGERFSQVEGKQGASDHCAVFMTLMV